VIAVRRESEWEVEKYIRKLGLPATILRPAAFMENYYIDQERRSSRNSGWNAASLGTRGCSFISRRWAKIELLPQRLDRF